MKKSIIYLFCLGLTISLSAQSIQNEVVSSSGASSSSTSFNIDYTVGEPVIELTSSTSFTLSQGFHQPSLYVTAIEDIELSDISCYPNPVNDNLVVEIPSSYTDAFVYTIYDLNGKILANETIYSGSSIIDMKSFAVGNYLLQVTETSSGKSFQSKILKIK
ncbi:MAG: T9SS type A sorting domain-containing protein [Bacteroidales bacterium]|nr:T9SS type A sorting domain-containing protein [Bacteroidales bacterium]